MQTQFVSQKLMKNDIFGIIAGNGDLPKVIIRNLQVNNVKFCVVSIGGIF